MDPQNVSQPQYVPLAPPITSLMPASLAAPTVTSPTTPPAYPYAGFWIRLGAGIVDSILFLIFSALVLNTDTHFGGSGIISDIVVFIAGFLYFILFEGSVHQATPGKILFGLKVFELSGQKMSYCRSVGRSLSKVLSLVIVGIGYFMIAFTGKKQGLHDLIAKTVVVRARKAHTGIIIGIPLVLLVLAILAAVMIGNKMKDAFTNFTNFGPPSIEYKIQKDVEDALNKKVDVTDTEKAQIIAAISKSIEIYTSKNTSRVRQHIKMAYPEQTEDIDDMDDEELLALLDEMLMFLPTIEEVKSSNTKWEITATKATVYVTSPGREVSIEANKRSGEWY